MTHDVAESRVKGLQKELLCWVEDHRVLGGIHPTIFNKFRRQVFKNTWQAFKLGRVGLRKDLTGPILWMYFFGWIDDVNGLELSPEVRVEVYGECFKVALQAFRLGALVNEEE